MKSIFNFFALFVLFSFVLCGITAFADEAEIFVGIDVSEWQGSIDFNAVKNDGVEVVYIRTGVGDDYQDPYLERNYKGFSDAGVKIGFYHYVTAASKEEAVRQAEFFVSLTENKNPSACLAMDFEYFYGLSDSMINEISRTFLETVEAKSGRKACVYSDAYNAKATFRGLTQYPLWVADYGKSEPESTGEWKSWSGFQYTDRGKISGIDTFVDRDYFKESILDNTGIAVPPQNRPKPPAKKYVTYTVKRGNTLWGIAKKFDTTIAKIAAINRIKNPNLIYTGEILKIDAGALSNEGYLTYRIKSGDTLWSIARRYNTTVENLVKINNIENPNLIYPNQIIKI